MAVQVAEPHCTYTRRGSHGGGDGGDGGGGAGSDVNSSTFPPRGPVNSIGTAAGPLASAYVMDTLTR